MTSSPPLVEAGPPAVRARGPRRSFGDVVAVAGVDLDIAPGAVFGLLGPDGAGKSTLIRLLATVLRPDGGEAEVFGSSVTSAAAVVTPQIGYMSQRFSMYPDLTVAENLEFFATVRGVARAERRSRAAALLASMGLAEFADRQAQYLSGGMKQKLMLATTLMHEPDLLLLDEPTNFLDITSIRWVERFLIAWPRELLVITHDRSFMDRVVTHVMGIHRQKVRKIAGTTDSYYGQIAQDEEIYEKTRLNDEPSLDETRETYYERQRFADVFAQAKRIPRSRIRDLAHLELNLAGMGAPPNWEAEW